MYIRIFILDDKVEEIEKVVFLLNTYLGQIMYMSGNKEEVK